jgi:RHS repeat-associated protein
LSPSCLTETGQLYYRARYYDPHRGRFISEDAIDYKDGLSNYAYVLGQPTTLVDPSGHIACPKNCPPDATQGARDACNFYKTIPDARVRRCMKDKCPIADLRCYAPDQGPCKGAPGPAYGGLEASSTITICAGNPLKQGTCYKRIIIHEMYDHLCRPGGPKWPQPQWPDHDKAQAYIKSITKCP